MKPVIKEEKYHTITDYLQKNYKFGAVIIFYEGNIPNSLVESIQTVGNDVTLINVLNPSKKVSEHKRLAIALYTKRAVEAARESGKRYIFVPKEVPCSAKNAEAICFLNDSMDNQTVLKGYLNMLLYLVFKIDKLAIGANSFFCPAPNLQVFLDVLTNQNQDITDPIILFQKYYSEIDTIYADGDFFDNLESIFVKVPMDICFVICYMLMSAEYIFTKSGIGDKLLLTDDRYFFRKQYLAVNLAKIGTPPNKSKPWVHKPVEGCLTRDNLSNIVQAYQKLGGKKDLNIDKTAVREILKTALAYSITDGYITKIIKIIMLYF